jgi:hypothetical protein
VGLQLIYHEIHLDLASFYANPVFRLPGIILVSRYMRDTAMLAPCTTESPRITPPTTLPIPHSAHLVPHEFVIFIRSRPNPEQYAQSRWGHGSSIDRRGSCSVSLGTSCPWLGASKCNLEMGKLSAAEELQLSKGGLMSYLSLRVTRLLSRLTSAQPADHSMTADLCWNTPWLLKYSAS